MWPRNEPNSLPPADQGPFYSPSRVTSTLAQWGDILCTILASHSLLNSLEGTELGISDTLPHTAYFGQHYLSFSTSVLLSSNREKSPRGQVRLLDGHARFRSPDVTSSGSSLPRMTDRCIEGPGCEVVVRRMQGFFLYSLSDESRNLALIIQPIGGNKTDLIRGRPPSPNY